MAYSLLPYFNYTSQSGLAVFNSLSPSGYYGVGVKGFSFSQYIVLYTPINTQVRLYRISPNTSLSSELDTIFENSGFPRDNPSIYNYGWLMVSPLLFQLRLARVVCSGNPPAGVNSTIGNDANSGPLTSMVVYRDNIPYHMYYITSGPNTENQGYYATGIYALEPCSTWEDLGDLPEADLYPITYAYSNSTISGPSEAAIGATVTVSAVPDNNYGITDPAMQILVTCNDVAVTYNWNPTTNTITFVMPDLT